MSRPGSTLIQDHQQGAEHLYDSIAPAQVRKWSPQYVSPPPSSNHYISAPATVTASPVSQVTIIHRGEWQFLKLKSSSLNMVNIFSDDICRHSLAVCLDDMFLLVLNHHCKEVEEKSCMMYS